MIRLVPLTEADFLEYLEPAIAGYAQEHVKGGRWQPEEALEKSRQEFMQLLPQGPATPGQYLFRIEAEGQKIGVLWFAVDRSWPQPRAWIYDIEIAEEFRGKGYGQQAMLALENKAKELGVRRIRLHVFGHNHTARALYEKLGYRVTNIDMAKDLD